MLQNNILMVLCNKLMLQSSTPMLQCNLPMF